MNVLNLNEMKTLKLSVTFVHVKKISSRSIPIPKDTLCYIRVIGISLTR